MIYGNELNFPDLIENTDVTFVLDTSESITETIYQYAKDYIRTIAEAMNIGQYMYNSRMAVIVFDDEATVYFNLNQYTDKNELITAIRNIPYNSGGTNITEALNFLKTVAESGSLGINRAKKQVAIFLTDGICELDDISSAAYSLKGTEIFELYAVGVGSSANLTQLKLIASKDDFVYYQLPFTKDTLQYFSEHIIERLKGLLHI